MKQVSIAAVQIKNFRSFVEETIIFPEGAGLNFLGGVNELEPRLEANGAGKTSLLEAIVWCIYGRSIRGARTSQIIRWGTENADVTVTLVIDGIIVDIARSGPPDRLNYDGKAATQEQVDVALGLTRERFLNSIIFGQGRPLFPDLSVSERGQLFDDILGLELWNRCSDIAKQRMTSAQALIQGHKLQLANIEGQLEALPSEEEMQKKIDEWEIQRDESIADKITAAEGVEDRLEAAKRSLEVSKGSSPAEEEKLRKILAEVQTLWRELSSHNLKEAGETALLGQLKRDREHIKQGKCAACGQKLPNAESSLKSVSEKITITEANVFNAKAMAGDVEKLYIELQKSSEQFRDDVATRRIEKATLTQQVTSLERELDQIAKAIEFTEKQINPHQDQLDQLREERAVLQQAQDDYQQQIIKAESEATALDYWKSAFKQIRLFYIGEVLSSLAVEVNSAVNSLGLLGWRVQFVTETENKSGTMKLGVQIEITDPRGRKGKWEDFGSGGEEQRTRLGIGLGMASLIQRAAGVIWDIEIHDEPTQYLSPQGVTDLLDALAHRAESQQKVIFVIDHRALTHSSFKEHWTVIKGLDGSKILQSERR